MYQAHLALAGDFKNQQKFTNDIYSYIYICNLSQSSYLQESRAHKSNATWKAMS